jgi:hypothetical protein
MGRVVTTELVGRLTVASFVGTRVDNVGGEVLFEIARTTGVTFRVVSGAVIVTAAVVGVPGRNGLGGGSGSNTLDVLLMSPSSLCENCNGPDTDTISMCGICVEIWISGGSSSTEPVVAD